MKGKSAKHYRKLIPFYIENSHKIKNEKIKYMFDRYFLTNDSMDKIAVSMNISKEQVRRLIHIHLRNIFNIDLGKFNGHKTKVQ